MMGAINVGGNCSSENDWNVTIFIISWCLIAAVIVIGIGVIIVGEVRRWYNNKMLNQKLRTGRSKYAVSEALYCGCAILFFSLQRMVFAIPHLRPFRHG